ncbi:tRNA uracil 4-sulfurtransferase ThiI [Oribacterium sp. HCP28S3_H8]|uniref:tRNA uracil 4-sulfurtransferase ThiI n=1 Tax=Oribacterium sp. HCP28S3_H8 TaxID=3438945 RepID=UPI003F8CD09F
MQYHSFLIKYAEIGTKGKNRYVFEDALVHDIRMKLKRVEGEFSVTRERGRIYVNAKSEDYDFDDVVNALQHVFGIVGICPMVQLKDVHEYRQVSDQVLTYWKEVYGDRKLSFKVRTRRADKTFPMNSEEISAELGHDILDAFPNTSVDVHTPEVLLQVEIRQYINIFSEVLPGAGGMPLGTNGKAMLLLSGGIDSPVAGYMISKRGAIIEACYFHAPPYTSERAKQKVIDLAKEVSQYSGAIALHVVNFTDIQLKIYEKCPHEELTIIMRRYMMRIAEAIAKRRNCIGLITGESIGQVASQTMQSLVCTNEVCTLPVYRPVIAFDKQEIVDISQRIGTYETSIEPYEDCCTIFVARHPVTKPIPEKIRASEKIIYDECIPMMEKAVNEAELIWCDASK